jgi:hypothetical protein
MCGMAPLEKGLQVSVCGVLLVLLGVRVPGASYLEKSTP